MTGAFVLSESQRAEYFEAAQRMRQLISQDYENVFSSGVRRNGLPLCLDFCCHRTPFFVSGQVDALLTPTTPTGPWPVAETAAMDPVTSYAHDVMTVPASLARLPAMNVPVGLRQSDNTPIGLQVCVRLLRAFVNSRYTVPSCMLVVR